MCIQSTCLTGSSQQGDEKDPECVSNLPVWLEVVDQGDEKDPECVSNPVQDEVAEETG